MWRRMLSFRRRYEWLVLHTLRISSLTTSKGSRHTLCLQVVVVQSAVHSAWVLTLIPQRCSRCREGVGNVVITSSSYAYRLIVFSWELLLSLHVLATISIVLIGHSLFVAIFPHLWILCVSTALTSLEIVLIFLVLVRLPHVVIVWSVTQAYHRFFLVEPFRNLIIVAEQVFCFLWLLDLPKLAVGSRDSHRSFRRNRLLWWWWFQILVLVLVLLILGDLGLFCHPHVRNELLCNILEILIICMHLFVDLVIRDD